MLKRLLNNQLFFDASYLTVSSYLTLLLGFLTQVIAARLLGAKDYGIVALAMTYPSIILSIASPKSVSVITRYISIYRAGGLIEKLKLMCVLGYGIDLTISTLSCVVIVFTSSFVSYHIYKLPDLSILMIIYAVSLPFLLLANTSSAILNSWNKYKYLSFLNAFEKIVTLGCFLLLISFVKGPKSLIMAYAVGQILYGLTSLLLTLYILYQDKINLFNFQWVKLCLQLDDSLKNELYSFFGWNYFLVTLTGFTAQLPIIALGYFWGPEEAGFYKIGTTLATSASYPKSSLAKIVYPKLSTGSKSFDWDRVVTNLKRWTLLAGIPLSLLTLLSALLVNNILDLSFGAKYISAVTGIQILFCGTAVFSLFFWIEPLYFAYAKFKLFTKLHILYFFFFAIFGYFLTLHFGFTGICIADFTSQVFLILLLLIPLQNKFS